jgi:hypothetical protein
MPKTKESSTTPQTRCDRTSTVRCTTTRSTTTVKEAFIAARDVYAELLETATHRTAVRAATDKDIQDNLKKAAESSRLQADPGQAGPQRRNTSCC